MAPAEPADAGLLIAVALGLAPGQVDEVDLRLPAGATVADALRASGLAERHAQLDVASLKVAVWGVLRSLDHPLRDRDRVELLRPLKVDPKEARRLRYRSQRSGKGR